MLTLNQISKIERPDIKHSFRSAFTWSLTNKLIAYVIMTGKLPPGTTLIEELTNILNPMLCYVVDLPNCAVNLFVR